MRHAFGIPGLTKSCFGKNQSYKVLTPHQRNAVKMTIRMHLAGLYEKLKNTYSHHDTKIQSLKYSESL